MRVTYLASPNTAWEDNKDKCTQVSNSPLGMLIMPGDSGCDVVWIESERIIGPKLFNELSMDENRLQYASLQS